MARKHKHEEHLNHEAWAIPYGDLVTLLLALFVVMYSISTVNEGKFRVMSDALSDALGGPPKSMKPVQLGEQSQRGSERETHSNIVQFNPIELSIVGGRRQMTNPAILPGPSKEPPQDQPVDQPVHAAVEPGFAAAKAIERMNDQIQKAMADLIDKNLVTVRHTNSTLEVEIRTDILFGSGSASIAAAAQPVLNRLAAIMRPFQNPLRIEGHTDTLPIHTAAFPSNWELSAARAASVVHLFTDQGVDPLRMSVAGFSQYRPAEDNTTEVGRNHNRRVLIVVLPDLNVGTDAPGAPSVVEAISKAVDAKAASQPNSQIAAPDPDARARAGAPAPQDTTLAAHSIAMDAPATTPVSGAAH